MAEDERSQIVAMVRRLLLEPRSSEPGPVHPILAALEARKEAQKLIPPCNLSQYREIVAVLPRPSDQQIDEYVQFVCEAHSWYKRLPLLPPGVPFRFFIDPNSGCDYILEPDGRVTYAERTENTVKFHYTWMTTSEYRRRFAHLAYAAGAATGPLLWEYAKPPVFANAGTSFRIPIEVAEAGSVPLTAIVHPDTAKVWVWKMFLPPPESRSWPSETGGERTLEQVIAVCERVTRPDDFGTQDVCEELLAQLLEPERQRLQREMGKAIRRMVQLVYGTRMLASSTPASG